MSDISKFFKKNKIARPNVFYAATKSLLDESGQPLEWEIRPISTKENERLTDECTEEVKVPGRRAEYRARVNHLEYMGRLVAASVVSPDLYNAKLQDDYGVKTPEALVKELVDDSGEYNALTEFIYRLNGFTPVADDIDTAKN